MQPDYEVPDDVERLAMMVAASASFRDWCAVDGELDADKRVHRLLVKHGDEKRWPWALIEEGPLNSEKIAGGAVNQYVFSSHVVLYLQTAMTHPEDEQRSLREFIAWARKVFFEIHEFAGGGDGQLNITGAQQKQTPVLSSDTGGAQLPYCWCSWEIPYSSV